HTRSTRDWSSDVCSSDLASGWMTTYTTPLGCTTKYTYTVPLPNPLQLIAIEDPRGYVTSYTYDSSKRVASIAMGSAVWTYVYPEIGRASCRERRGILRDV